MDSNDPRNPFVLEAPRIVLDDLLSTARRKRRATRMSYMPPRPRKRPAGDSSYGCGSICSFGNFLRDKSTAFECKYLGSICREGRGSRVLANGLQRSLSFPTDSYEINKSMLCITRIGIPYRRIGYEINKSMLCITRIGIPYRRIGGSQENKAEYLQTYGVGLTLPKHTSNVPPQLVGSGHCVEKSPLHLAKAVSDIALLYLGNASFERDKHSGDGGGNPSQKSNGNVDVYAFERAKQSFDGIGTPSQESNGNLDTYAHKVDTRDGISPKILTDDLHLVGRTALSKSTEGELCNISRDCTLMVSQVRSPPSAKMLTCGRRREMEDTAVCVPSFMKIPKLSSSDNAQNDADSSALHFYAVYDGHGGSQVSIGDISVPLINIAGLFTLFFFTYQASVYCAQRFHHALKEEITFCSLTGSSGTDDWKRAMSSCFMKVDKEVGGVCPYGTCNDIQSTANCCSGTIAPENVGTTAVVAVISSSHIAVANCGDSRALLCKGGEAIPLSQDHKPDRVDETKRIEDAGGCVIPFKGHRVVGLLALSRAIGDRYLKRYVISEPDVVCLERSDEDEFLILASDGLWDVIDNKTACDVARRCFASTCGGDIQCERDELACAKAASTLVKLACSKGSEDNISVLVVDLRLRQQ